MQFFSYVSYSLVKPSRTLPWTGGMRKESQMNRWEPHCLKINDTETGEVSGRVPKVLRQKDDTERMEA